MREQTSQYEKLDVPESVYNADTSEEFAAAIKDLPMPTLTEFRSRTNQKDGQTRETRQLLRALNAEILRRTKASAAAVSIPTTKRKVN